MQQDLQPVIIFVEQTQGLQTMVPTKCNEIIFINLGAATATIEKFPLLPGASITMGGNRGEVIINALRIVQQVSGDVWYMKKTYKK